MGEAMSAIGAPAGKLEIGKVLRETGSIIRRAPGVLIPLALICGGVPQLLIGVLGLQTAAGATPQIDGAFWSKFAIAMVIQLVIASIGQGAMIHAAGEEINDRPANLGDSFSVGLKQALPMIGLMIVVYIFTLIGFMLLVVPGMIVAIALSVAIPSLVLERLGIGAALTRSRQLTKGNRWRLFGLFLIVGVIFWVMMLVIGMLFGGLGAVASGGLTAYTLVGGPLVGTIAALVFTTGLAVLHVELRRLRDGTGAENLGKVFE